MPNVKLVGFHQHHGRHKRSTRYWEAQMAAYAAEIGRVCQALGGYRPQELDIGGGFAIPRDPFNAATNYTEPAQYAALTAISRVVSLLGPRSRYAVMTRLVATITGHPNRHPAPSIEAYAEVCTATLRRELARHGIETRGVTLQLEPGRAMHGDQDDVVCGVDEKSPGTTRVSALPLPGRPSTERRPRPCGAWTDLTTLTNDVLCIEYNDRRH